jgi:hypothetical protein
MKNTYVTMEIHKHIMPEDLARKVIFISFQESKHWFGRPIGENEGI